jgi:hypothetical protein
MFINDGDDISRRPWYMRGGEQRPYTNDPQAALFPEDSPGDDRCAYIIHKITLIPHDYRILGVPEIITVDGTDSKSIPPQARVYHIGSAYFSNVIIFFN